MSQRTRLMIVLTVLAVSVSLSFRASADDEVTMTASVGTTDGEYVLGEGGYWWKDSSAYVREQEWVEGSWYQAQSYNGCYSCYRWYQKPGYYRYKYRQVLSRSQKDFWSRLAEIKGQIEEDRLKAQAIGAAFPSQASAYASASSYHQPAAYSYQQVTQAYGPIDVNAAIQQYGEAVKASVQAGSAATQDLGGVAQDIAGAANDLAMFREKLKAILDTQPPAGSRTQTTITQNGVTSAEASVTTGDPDAAPQPQILPRVNANFTALDVLQSNCAACHSAGKEFVAKFDVANWPRMSMAQRSKVWAIVAHEDPAKRMPKAGAHGELPGKPLPLAHRKKLLEG